MDLWLVGVFLAVAFVGGFFAAMTCEAALRKKPVCTRCEAANNRADNLEHLLEMKDQDYQALNHAYELIHQRLMDVAALANQPVAITNEHAVEQGSESL